MESIELEDGTEIEVGDTVAVYIPEDAPNTLKSGGWYLGKLEHISEACGDVIVSGPMDAGGTFLLGRERGNFNTDKVVKIQG